jgi:hypothetical protein
MRGVARNGRAPTTQPQYEGRAPSVAHTSALTSHLLRGNLLAAVLSSNLCMHTRSGTPQSPPDAPHPASPTAPPAISNRQWKGLEIAVTHTNKTPNPFLIDNENAPSRVTPRTWSRHSCLRDAPYPIPLCARTTPARRVAQAGVRLCAVVSRAFEIRPSSTVPFMGRGISLRVFSVLPRTLTAAPVATQLIISNRSARRLEMPESYTKQRTDPLSNRHKFTHRQVTSPPTSSIKHHRARRSHPPALPPNSLHLAFVDATLPIAYHFVVTHHLGWASASFVSFVVASSSSSASSAAKRCARA